jgi:hypothetical protein
MFQNKVLGKKHGSKFESETDTKINKVGRFLMRGAG